MLLLHKTSRSNSTQISISMHKIKSEKRFINLMLKIDSATIEIILLWFNNSFLVQLVSIWLGWLKRQARAASPPSHESFLWNIYLKSRNFHLLYLSGTLSYLEFLIISGSSTDCDHSIPFSNTINILLVYFS